MVQFHLPYVKAAVKINPDAKAFLKGLTETVADVRSLYVKQHTVSIFIAIFYQVAQKLGINVFVPFLDWEYFYFLEEVVSTV